MQIANSLSAAKARGSNLLKIVPLAALLSLGATVAAQAQEKTLVINGFGGEYERVQGMSVIESFEKENNVKIEVITGYSAEVLAKLRAQKSSPQYDIVQFGGGQEVEAAREGLLVPITPAQLSTYSSLHDFAVAHIQEGEGPTFAVAPIGIIFDHDKVTTPITSWNDLHRPDVARDVALVDVSNSYGLLAFLMINQIAGGTLDDVEPGIAFVQKILAAGGTILSKSPEIQQSFAQGSITVAPYAQDYAHVLIKSGLPLSFVIPEEGAPASFITINLVANRPNQDLAVKFIDRVLQPNAQAANAEFLGIAPTNKDTELPENMDSSVLLDEASFRQIVRFDPSELSAKRAKIVEAWNRAIAH